MPVADADDADYIFTTFHYIYYILLFVYKLRSR